MDKKYIENIVIKKSLIFFDFFVFWIILCVYNLFYKKLIMKKILLWWLLLLPVVLSWYGVNAQEKNTVDIPKVDPAKIAWQTEIDPNINTNINTNGVKPIEENKCNWIKLNTDFPLVWDCIGLKKWEGKVNALNVFQTMLWSLMRIVSSIILVVCFIMIILAWIKWSANDPKWATDLIKKVAITVLLLWLSGVILKVINPTFFS